MRIINRTQFNNEAIIKAWGLTLLEDIEYLIFEKVSKRSVGIHGMHKNGERICSLVDL